MQAGDEILVDLLRSQAEGGDGSDVKRLVGTKKRHEVLVPLGYGK